MLDPERSRLEPPPPDAAFGTTGHHSQAVAGCSRSGLSLIL